METAIARQPNQGVLPPALVAGFIATIAVWITWFITHLPWLGMPEPVASAIILVVWVIAVAAATRSVGPRAAIRVGIAAGLVAAVFGLLVLGSKLTEVPESGTGAAGPVKPAWPILVAGFLGLGALLGLLGGFLSRLAPASDHWTGQRPWLGRFAVVTVAAIAPLLFVGGLGTSTESGMAVPDWPRTFGANMFLYPLGPRADAGVYLEHAHRLFGALIGLAVLTLAIWVQVSASRGWVKVWAWAIFVFVTFQGILGGTRVTANSDWLAFFHGVSAQLIFAAAVALAVYLSPLYQSAVNAEPDAGLRRLKALGTAALHVTILQLIFGAMYRHVRSSHALWSHIGFSIVVAILVLIAGFFAVRVATALRSRHGAVVRRTGTWVLACVAVQFLLGWVVFFVGGRDAEAANLTQALLRTLHQANGALLLALVTLLAVVARRMWKQTAPAKAPAAIPPAAAPA